MRREQFFKDDFIRELWEAAVPYMTEKVCFKKGITTALINGY